MGLQEIPPVKILVQRHVWFFFLRCWCLLLQNIFVGLFWKLHWWFFRTKSSLAMPVIVEQYFVVKVKQLISQWTTNRRTPQVNWKEAEVSFHAISLGIQNWKISSFNYYYFRKKEDRGSGGRDKWWWAC